MCARCTELEAENRELRRDLAYETDELLVLNLKAALGLMAQIALLLSLLYRARGKAVSNRLLETLMEGRSQSNDVHKQVKVQLSRLRTRLGPGSVVTIWGQGYRLSPAAIAKVDAALAILPGLNPIAPKVAA